MAHGGKEVWRGRGVEGIGWVRWVVGVGWTTLHTRGKHARAHMNVHIRMHPSPAHPKHSHTAPTARSPTT